MEIDLTYVKTLVGDVFMLFMIWGGCVGMFACFTTEFLKDQLVKSRKRHRKPHFRRERYLERGRIKSRYVEHRPSSSEGTAFILPISVVVSVVWTILFRRQYPDLDFSWICFLYTWTGATGIFKWMKSSNFAFAKLFDSYTSKVSSEIENATVVYDSTETAVSDTTADEETSSDSDTVESDDTSDATETTDETEEDSSSGESIASEEDEDTDADADESDEALSGGSTKTTTATTESNETDTESTGTFDSSGYTAYTVVKGNTLWELAKEYLGSGTKWKEILQSDGSAFVSGDIDVGDLVWIPGTVSTATAASEYGIEKIGTNYGFRSPVKVLAISQMFKRGTHYGLDIVARDASGNKLSTCDIVSSTPGTVVTADTTDDNSMGKYVTVRYDDTSNNCTWYVYYLHLESVGVRVGQTVSVGTKLGTMGTTGTSTGVHLHIDFNKVSYGASFHRNSQKAACSIDPLTCFAVWEDDGQSVTEKTLANHKSDIAIRSAA